MADGITSCDAKRLVLKAPRCHLMIISGILLALFGRKRARHVMNECLLLTLPRTKTHKLLGHVPILGFGVGPKIYFEKVCCLFLAILQLDIFKTPTTVSPQTRILETK